MDIMLRGRLSVRVCSQWSKLVVWSACDASEQFEFQRTLSCSWYFCCSNEHNDVDLLHPCIGSLSPSIWLTLMPRSRVSMYVASLACDGLLDSSDYLGVEVGDRTSPNLCRHVDLGILGN